MNRYAHHCYVIPEDDRDRQFADGFVLHHQMKSQRILVMPPAGGWSQVRKTFTTEYIARLRQYPQGHVVMLIDFDGRYVDRRKEFDDAIPQDLKQRVFVLGSKVTPEDLKKELGKTFEHILLVRFGPTVFVG
jgi:hypothetical protein